MYYRMFYCPDGNSMCTAGKQANIQQLVGTKKWIVKN